MSGKVFIHKLLHWEYWPAYMFYIPNIPLIFYLTLKARSLTFFTTTNPSMKSSGSGVESKFKTIQLIPEKYRPKTVLVTPHSNFEEVLIHLASAKIEFPIIAKPDIGFRGLLVKKINSSDELNSYLKSYPITIILQEFIPYKNECGIFYNRIPGEKDGSITSITLKKFLSVTGDGSSTLSELILSDERARIYYELLLSLHKKSFKTIPNKNEKIILNVIGNHSKGTQFIDGCHLINQKLTQVLNNVNAQIDGWYYGRIDLKYKSLELLEKGENFKILEINGIISEPTHVYDASKNSYFDALKSIRTHWKLIHKIALKNHHTKNIPFKKPSVFIKEIKDLKNYTRKIAKLSI